MASRPIEIKLVGFADSTLRRAMERAEKRSLVSVHRLRLGPWTLTLSRRRETS